MFYSQYVLAKKGALGRVWLAAHWDRKLTKAQIFNTDIRKSVESIINPDVPMALRMSGHLLLGVSRIYARKVKYLLIDCNDALIKIKMAYRPGETQIDLQPDQVVASYASITLPETYGEFEITIPEVTSTSVRSLLEAFPLPPEERTDLLNLNIAKKREITLQLRGIEDVRDETQQEAGTIDLLPSWNDDDPLLRDDWVEGEDRPELLRHDQAVAGTDLITPQQTPRLLPEDQDMGISYEPTDLGVTPQPEPTTPGLAPPSTPRLGVEPTEMEIETPKVKAPKRPTPIQIDERLIIASKVIKRHLVDVSPIVREPQLAPINKKAMLRRARELQGPETVLNQPILEGINPDLLHLFTRNMTTLATAQDVARVQIEEDQSHLEPGDVIDYNLGGGEDVGDISISAPPAPEEEEEYIPPVVTGPEEPRVAEVPSVGLSERSKRMYRYLNSSFGKDKASLSYLGMVEGKKRKTVVGTFFELLVLKTKSVIEVEQREPYQDIIVTKAAKFETAFANA